MTKFSYTYNNLIDENTAKFVFRNKKQYHFLIWLHEFIMDDLEYYLNDDTNKHFEHITDEARKLNITWDRSKEEFNEDLSKVSIFIEFIDITF